MALAHSRHLQELYGLRPAGQTLRGWSSVLDEVAKPTRQPRSAASMKLTPARTIVLSPGSRSISWCIGSAGAGIPAEWTSSPSVPIRLSHRRRSRLPRRPPGSSRTVARCKRPAARPRRG